MRRAARYTSKDNPPLGKFSGAGEMDWNHNPSRNMTVDDEFYGRMTDPTAGAWHTGPCGDTVEFYLVIEGDVIRTAR